MSDHSENIQQETQVDCSTKVGGLSHKTHLTIDWSGMSARDLQQIAEGRLVIRFQDEHRRKSEIPGRSATLKATDFRVGTRHSAIPMTAEQALAKLTPEELQALLAKKGLA